jgi:hypothetical protein
LEENWTVNMPALVQAYMEYKYGPGDDMDTESTSGSVFHVMAIHTFGELTLQQ